MYSFLLEACVVRILEYLRNSSTRLFAKLILEATLETHGVKASRRMVDLGDAPSMIGTSSTLIRALKQDLEREVTKKLPAGVKVWVAV